MRIGIMVTLIRKFKSDDFTTRQLPKIETDLKVKQEFKLLDIEQESTIQKEDELQNQIVRLNEKIVKLNADSGVSIEELEKRTKILIKKKEDVTKQKSSIQDRITHREELQIDLEVILDKFDEEDLEIGISNLKEAKDKLRDVESTLDKIQIKLDSLYERKEHLDSHKYNENCDICMENSKSILDTKDKVKIEIKESESTLQEQNEKKLHLNLDIETLSKYEKEWNNFKEAQEKEDKIDREIGQLINKLSTTETEEIRLDSQIAQQEQLVSDYYANEKQIKKNKEIRDEIVDVRSDLDKVKQIIKNNNADILSLNGKISALQNQKETIEDRIQEVKDLEEQSKLYQFYLSDSFEGWGIL